ncbi:MAG: hypothetical protein DI627_14325 [Acinetobacter sp.]|uniref:hypothetical protein n=1 Tax=Acinetobacter sp. TaxID=472 RepID=UPI000DB0B532|nr:hypothetical protein [Acinetobacter sp.]PZT84903.1 MAG: hypothetical protein DI627_14325 [Acinetobacter sp.]
MEIKYLKDAPLGKKGQKAIVQDHEGKVLIALGFAKEIKLKPSVVTLLNLNGSPVIDDFGSVAQVVVN